MSKQFWESRWENNQIGWDLGEVSPPLKKYFDQLTNKDLRILIPGCGNAYEAEYLYNSGFKNVFVVEIAKEAIDSFIKRCQLFPKSQIIQGDFFDLKESFDLIIEQTFFCAINPQLRNQYVKKMHNLISRKGKLVGLMFNRTFVEGPPFGGDTNEYKSLFTPYFKIITMAICHNSILPRQGSEVFIILQIK